MDTGVDQMSGGHWLFMEKGLHITFVAHPDGAISLEKQSSSRRSKFPPIEGGIAMQNDLQIDAVMRLLSLAHPLPKPSPVLAAVDRNEEINIRMWGDVG
jgi:hypothetical protein